MRMKLGDLRRIPLFAGLLTLLILYPTEVAASQNATLNVYVVDRETNQALDNAQVFLVTTLEQRKKIGLSDQGVYPLTPQGQGTFERPEVLPGRYVVFVKAYRYSLGLRPVELVEGSGHREAFALEKSGLIRGVVRDASGNTVNEATVSVSPTDIAIVETIEAMSVSPLSAVAMSDEFGEFAIRDFVMPDKEFALEVFKEGYLPTLSPVAKVGAGQEVWIDVQLDPAPALLDGQVVNEKGNPVEGAIISLRAKGQRENVLKSSAAAVMAPQLVNALRPQTKSRPDGRFNFPNLPAGDFLLKVRKQGYRPYTAQLTLTEGRESLRVLLEPLRNPSPPE